MTIPERGLFVGGRGSFARTIKVIFIIVMIIAVQVIACYAIIGIGMQFGRKFTLLDVYLWISAVETHLLLFYAAVNWVLNPPQKKSK